jgi:chromate reductase
MRLLAISGSLRRDSYNSALVAAAAAACPLTVDFVVWRGLADIPAFDEDIGPVPREVQVLRDELEHADAVLIATPEYNASVPGALKNALDWASRPYPGNCLLGTPVAVVGASTGYFGGVWAQAELRKILKVIGAAVLEAELRVPVAHTAFTADGRLRDPERAAALRSIVHELVAHTARSAA